MSAKPIRKHVDGAPVQPGQRVRVVCAVDHIGNVGRLIGRSGTVRALVYGGGTGQTYPGDPLVDVTFPGGKRESFWKQEIEVMP